MQTGGGGDWTAGSVAHSLWCSAALGELPLAGLQFETLNDKASAKRGRSDRELALGSRYGTGENTTRALLIGHAWLAFW